MMTSIGMKTNALPDENEPNSDSFSFISAHCYTNTHTYACAFLSKWASVTKRSAFRRMTLYLLNAKLLSLIIDTIDVVHLSTFGDYARTECDFVFRAMLLSKKMPLPHGIFMAGRCAVARHRCPYSICVSNLLALRTCQVNLIPMTLSFRKHTRATHEHTHTTHWTKKVNPNTITRYPIGNAIFSSSRSPSLSLSVCLLLFFLNLRCRSTVGPFVPCQAVEWTNSSENLLNLVKSVWSQVRTHIHQNRSLARATLMMWNNVIFSVSVCGHFFCDSPRTVGTRQMAHAAQQNQCKWKTKISININKITGSGKMKDAKINFPVLPTQARERESGR